LNNAFEGGDVSVAPKAEIAGRDAAFGNNGRGFEDDQARAALSAAAEMDEMPIGGNAVLRGVLAHGRYADAIGKTDRTELERRKKRMAHYILDARGGGGIQSELLWGWWIPRCPAYRQDCGESIKSYKEL